MDDNTKNDAVEEKKDGEVATEGEATKEETPMAEEATKEGEAATE